MKDCFPLLFLSLCSHTLSIPAVSLPPTHSQALLVADWELTFCETIKNPHYWKRKEGRNQRNRHLFTVSWSALQSFPSLSTFLLACHFPTFLSFFFFSWHKVCLCVCALITLDHFTLSNNEGNIRLSYTGISSNCNGCSNVSKVKAVEENDNNNKREGK